MSIRDQFLEFSIGLHAPGSGAPSSYVKALNLLTEALHTFNPRISPNETIWDIRDVSLLWNLYQLSKSEQKKDNGGIFQNISSTSYWKKGFISAAMREYTKFILIHCVQEEMFKTIDRAKDATTLAKELDSIKISASPALFDSDDFDFKSREGKTALQEVQVRINQYVFRKMVLKDYHQTCCLTGLTVPEILRASHISEWAKDEPNRMNPENGLCLSATYDAAFDRHLISFDDDYRLILAPSLKEYYTNEAFKKFFVNLQGRRIMLPQKFLPSKKLLELHRKQMH
jgi:putative restriction endonuclease